MKRVSLFGSAFKYGQRLNGVDKGPYKLRELGLVGAIEKHGYKVDNYDIYYPTMKRNETRTLGHYSAEMAKRIYKQRKKGRKIINIGGDHSVAIGSVNGVLSYDPETVVVWVDAHGDINTQASSITKNTHGMPVAFLTGLENNKLLSDSKYLEPKLSFDQLGYIGIRDLDPYEVAVINKHNIVNYSSDEVINNGSVNIMENVMKHLDPENNKPIHLSFDIDALDPLDAPGTGVKANNGLSVSHAHDICDYLNRTNRVVAMDMVEVNPDLDRGNKTANLAISLIESVFKTF